ncbi:MAG: DUF1957 domain-containing protein [Candidatus Hydrogenedentota bacterium]|nr:MAG: DUF1957 domain-containing protein [Candidatus Hydrogenedentota bacterium]
MKGAARRRPVFLSIILHAHLPFLRQPEYEHPLEEIWFHEAMLECYLPLARCFRNLHREEVPFRLAFSFSPTLSTMMRDRYFRERFERFLNERVELAEREVERFWAIPALQRLACFYHRRFLKLKRFWEEEIGGDIISLFRELEEEGRLELMTTAATHAYLPVFDVEESTVEAQVKIGVESHRQHFGRIPPGFWLPECGYTRNAERALVEAGIRYTVLDFHGLRRYGERGRCEGAWGPGPAGLMVSKSGLYLFGRDPDASRLVWSARDGYPADGVYREFHRDGLEEAEFGYARPYRHPLGSGVPSGMKYHRVTSLETPLRKKEIYDPGEAEKKAREHARAFLKWCERRRGERETGIVVPFDAELFGHWWYEGPEFLESLIREARESVVRLRTPGDLLKRKKRVEKGEGVFSSWGNHGFSSVWLDPSNDWIYPELHRASEAMRSAALRFWEEGGDRERILNQAVRELLLAQASDWPFMMKAGTTVGYARTRFLRHIERFWKLLAMAESGETEEAFLRDCEDGGSVFPWIDFRIFGLRNMRKGRERQKAKGKRQKGKGKRQKEKGNRIFGA